jgi:hypothetical protein
MIYRPRVRPEKFDEPPNCPDGLNPPNGICPNGELNPPEGNRVNDEDEPRFELVVPLEEVTRGELVLPRI